MVVVVLTATLVAGTVPTSSGGLFRTVMSNSWVASSPPTSRAVIVTVTVPRAWPVTVTVLPVTVAVATRESDTVAEYVSGSASGSSK